MRLTYHHVKSPQDRHKAWETLPLDQQVNVVCDALAGAAILRGISIPAVLVETAALLPMERAVLIVNGVKATGDATELVRHMLGREAAKQFFLQPVRKVARINVGGLEWSEHRFNLVDWEGLRDGLKSRPGGLVGKTIDWGLRDLAEHGTHHRREGHFMP